MSTSSQLLPDLEEAQTDPDDKEDEEGGRDLEDDMKSKTGSTDCPLEWTSPECLAVVYAVMAANRESCNVLRAERAAESAEAQNVINPLHRKQLNSDGSMPSGSSKEEILVKTKVAYYQKAVEKDSKTAGLSMSKGM